MLQTGAKGTFSPRPQKCQGFWRFWASTNASFCSSEKEEKRKERAQNSPKEKKESQVLIIREVCYPQGVIVELDIHHQLSPPIITIFLSLISLTCTYDLIV